MDLRSKYRVSVFLLTVAACFGSLLLLSKVTQDFRRDPIDFAAFEEQTIVSMGPMLSRRQRSSVKLGYAERSSPPETGVFGNHQIQYFSARSAFEQPRPGQFFNYWYANLSLPEVRDYLAFLASIDRLPSRTVIIHITTPNNDNGQVIIDYGRLRALPADVEFFFEKQQRSAFDAEWLFDLAAEIEFDIGYRVDWKTVISNLVTLIYGDRRYVVFDRRTCADIRAARQAARPTLESGSLAGGFLERAGAMSQSFFFKVLSWATTVDLVAAYCRGETVSDIRFDGFEGFRLDGFEGYRFDGSSFGVRDNALRKNENPLVPSRSALKPGDEHLIATYMRQVIGIVERAGRVPVFLITPVFESERWSAADQIFSRALALVPEANVIDHRKQFREARYFHSYDHPNEAYFREVAVEMRSRGYLPPEKRK
jgi:hypothetical protein